MALARGDPIGGDPREVGDVLSQEYAVVGRGRLDDIVVGSAGEAEIGFGRTPRFAECPRKESNLQPSDQASRRYQPSSRVSARLREVGSDSAGSYWFRSDTVRNTVDDRNRSAEQERDQDQPPPSRERRQ